MQFSLAREQLLKPLQLVSGVVEKRQTLPVLSNVLLEVDGSELLLTGTDLEVELVGRVVLSEPSESGSITVPAKKFLDIVRSLPDDSIINLKQNEERVIVSSGRSKFTLTTLPAAEFPSIEKSADDDEYALPQSSLSQLINATSFAMAQQDVRYYLNGMSLELNQSLVRTVATDGHRLAMSYVTVDGMNCPEKKQVIVPRKGILELNRLLTDLDASIKVYIGASHLRATTEEFSFTTKLVDGKFPDYERVLPRGGDKEVVGDRQALKSIFSRAAILSNEKYRGVRMILSEGNLLVKANNPEQEEAEVMVEVDYSGPELEVGFNVNYVLDVLGVISGEQVKFVLSDANSSALVTDFDDESSAYVVMPMRL
ncbi:DNA polymerase III subunit beta [Reinekea thalattae]|uniref:Beta sliding clamp n=1 Tax=Reinekea thalattae TaxID=2593301 RepID=A0A5C8ZA79_9GAMM|nr:DNA polymerase III subunit beta [Reinekea thalattae]TXR55005.1 DNA polymerase III subunit beta [Reinekea thalattae]